MARSTPPKTIPDRRTRAPIPRPMIDVSSYDSDDNDAHPDPKIPLVIDISSDGEGYEDACCAKCGSGESGAAMLCDKCDKRYHLFCLRPILVSVPKGLWVSLLAPIARSSTFPLVQTKIIDFFRIQTSSESTQKLVLNAQKKRKQPCRSLISKKKKRSLLPFNPIDDPVCWIKQMASLATALMATGAQFSNELTYSSGMARRSANRAAFEKGGIQVLCKEEVETLNLCKSMTEKGLWPPLMVVSDPQEGFIRDLTILTEYARDVDCLENREDYDGDSMIMLFSASNPSRSLVSCLDKCAEVINLSFFVAGKERRSRT